MARRRFSRKARAAAIRNLRKARAALRRRSHRRVRRVVRRARRSVRRVVRRVVRRRRFTAKARAASLRNLIKARAALRRKGPGRRAYFRKIGAKGLRMKAFKKELAERAEVYGGYGDNPFRKGKVRRYFGRRRSGTVIKSKGHFRIISKLRNGVRVTRPWARH